ncbi:MAG TPA: hypothetical protein QF468_00115 [Nitrospinota bacterium]|jgi:hypothetical protein|nr:hypothetical protein [Nitrospinota bacterium]|tara:strand:+ start:409 stop:732 length:324 start_codon:yes stop_codon:yes gene_type:complete
MRLLKISASCAVLVVIIASCSTPPLKRAFDGEFSKVENNRVIFEYCQSCHVHNELIPAPHVAEKTSNYKSKKFRETKECRTCHYINEDFFGDVERKTIRPKKGRHKI